MPEAVGATSGVFRGSPNYLGEFTGGKLVPGPMLEPLGAFDWQGYRLLVSDDPPSPPSGPERYLRHIADPMGTLRLSLSSGQKLLVVKERMTVADLLKSLPTVSTFQSGDRLIFAAAEGAGLETVRADLAALLQGLRADLASWEWLQTGLTDWPGCLGSSWDGDLTPGPELASLQTFDWEAYQELAESDQRSLEVDLPTGRTMVPFDVYDDIAVLLGALPAIEAWSDSGPDDAAASGSGYNYWLADGFQRTDVADQVSALLDALRRDLEGCAARS